MNSTFQYSLLKYRHSQLGDEVINVGILFAFITQGQFLFMYPKKISRLKWIYSNFPESLVKGHLSGFENHAKKLSRQTNFEQFELSINNIDSFIQREFLVNDSSALQFSPAKSAVLFNSNLNKTAEEYFSLYFCHFLTSKLIEERYNEEKIIKDLRTKLLARDQNIDRYLKKDYSVQAKNIAVKFDIAWQNKRLHLVKPVSFDLLDGQSIQQKSATYFGYFSLLAEEGEKNNYAYDILIARPKNRHLLDSFYNARDVLFSCPGPTNIIEHSSLDEYSEKTVSQIER